MTWDRAFGIAKDQVQAAKMAKAAVKTAKAAV